MDHMKDVVNIRLKVVYEFLREHYKPLLIFSAPIIVIYYILRITLINPNQTFKFNSYMIANISLNLIYTGTLITVMIYIIDSLNNNKKISNDGLKVFFKKNFLVITSSFLLVVFFTYIGLVLLIVPGIYIFTRLAVVPYLIGIDDVKWINAFNLSFEYSKKFTWPMFFCLIIISFISLNLGAIIAFLGLNLNGFAGTVIFSLTYIIDLVLIYHFYLDIKAIMVEDYKKIHSLKPPK